MFVILVEHFFDAQGRERFPTWVHRIGSAASRYPGFIDIQQMTPLGEPDRCCFMMSFETPQDAQQWITSSDRKIVLALMEPYPRGEHHATRWLAGESWSSR